MRGEAFWWPACASRLHSVEFQPGPTWHVWVELNAVRFELPDGKFPADVFAMPGSRVRIEYLNAGGKSATARLTLWVEPLPGNTAPPEPPEPRGGKEQKP
jgi:hypothetical protein